MPDLRSILMVLLVLAGIAILKTFMGFFPQGMDCLWRWRSNLQVERNIHVSDERDLCLLVILYGCAMMSCFAGTLDMDISSMVPDSLGSLVPIAVVLGYFILRGLFFLVIEADCMRKEAVKSEWCAGKTFLFDIGTVSLTAGCICLVLGVQKEITNAVIYGIWGVMYLFALTRCWQILRNSASGLQSFLYLCGLEIIPTASVALAVILL